MRFWLPLAARIASAVLLCSVPLLAQEAEGGEAAGGHLAIWKLLNTAIFAALLVWFLAKYAPRFFNARSADIQKAIQDATGLKIEADFRYSEIDKKMAGLAEEVKRIREQSGAEMAREHDRIRRQTELEIGRIRQNAANEIDALRQEAADRVQLHAAKGALSLAEKQLQERFAQGEPADLIDNFIRLVERGRN
jgi:F-type H+-transporting ATPase subunit b